MNPKNGVLTPTCKILIISAKKWCHIILKIVSHVLGDGVINSHPIIPDKTVSYMEVNF